MKKTIIRIVAVAMLALMVLTALPAFAYNIVGTAAAQTPVYKDTKGRKVELYVSGHVTINRQDNKSGMYIVTVSYDGKTYTGWVYPSAISGIGYDKSNGGSASGSTSGTTGGTTSGVTGTYTATIATGAAINVNGTNYPVSVGGSINVNYRDAAGTQVNVTVGNVTGSNIANLLLVMGGPALFSPIPYDAAYNLDLVLVAAFSLALVGFAYVGRRHEMSRVNGVIFVVLYAAYIATSVMR